MESQVDSNDLKKKVIPQYDVACKRITVSNDYLPALNQPNVHLVTDRIQSIEKDFVQMKESSDSSEVTEKTIPLDAIIYATGFDLLSVFEGIAIERPSDGKLLSDIWGSFPSAYLGTMQPQFPNLFFFLGPGTGLGKYVQRLIRIKNNYYIFFFLKNFKHLVIMKFVKHLSDKKQMFFFLCPIR